MFRRLVTDTPVMAGIIVTPIIDVALVLVIILLITAPMMSVADLDLELPEARTHAFGEETHVNVTLGRDGRLAIDDDIVVDATFIDGLRAKLAEDPNALVVIRADAGAPYGAVRTVLQDARAAGGTRLAIAARPATAEAQ